MPVPCAALLGAARAALDCGLDVVVEGTLPITLPMRAREADRGSESGEDDSGDGCYWRLVESMHRAGAIVVFLNGANAAAAQGVSQVVRQTGPSRMGALWPASGSLAAPSGLACEVLLSSGASRVTWDSGPAAERIAALMLGEHAGVGGNGAGLVAACDDASGDSHEEGAIARSPRFKK